MARGGRRWLCLLSLLLWPLPAAAATYTAGPGEVDAYVSRLQPGDTLYLRDGVYHDGRFGDHAGVRMPSGTASAPITIAAVPGARPILTGPNAGISFQHGESYITFDGIAIHGSGNVGWLTDASVHHIRFLNGELQGGTFHGSGSFMEWRNNDVHHSPGYGWYWSGTDSVIAGNRIYDNAGFAVHIYVKEGQVAHRNVVEHNVIERNGFGSQAGYEINGGVIMSHGTGNIVRNNVLRDNHSGIQVDYSCLECVVENNTITGSRWNAGIYVGATARGTRISGNQLSGNAGDVVDQGQGTQFAGHGAGANLSTPRTGGGSGGVGPPTPPARPAPRHLRLLTLP